MKILLLLSVASCAVWAQISPSAVPGTPQGFVLAPGSVSEQQKPIGVPTSTTTVVSADAYLQTVTVSNPTASAITFSLCDKQVSPICVLPAVSVAANTTYVIAWPAYYWCPGGFTVLAGASGLTWYGGWRQ